MMLDCAIFMCSCLQKTCSMLNSPVKLHAIPLDFPQPDFYLHQADQILSLAQFCAISLSGLAGACWANGPS